MKSARQRFWLQCMAIAAVSAFVAGLATEGHATARDRTRAATHVINEDSGGLEYDPIEPFNRAMYRFNYVVDGLLLRPFTSIYRGVVPEFGRDMVHNALTNMTEPVVVLNSVLQGDTINAFTALWRFIINSTVGVLGVFDPASHIGLKHRAEDFGQTLGYYGGGTGGYLVLPLLGPSSFRDAFGRVVDVFTDPFFYLYDWEGNVIRGVATAADTRDRNMKLIDDVYATSLDPYATFRSLYLQKRAADIKKSRSEPVGGAKTEKGEGKKPKK